MSSNNLLLILFLCLVSCKNRDVKSSVPLTKKHIEESTQVKESNHISGLNTDSILSTSNGVEKVDVASRDSLRTFIDNLSSEGLFFEVAEDNINLYHYYPDVYSIQSELSSMSIEQLGNVFNSVSKLKQIYPSNEQVNNDIASMVTKKLRRIDCLDSGYKHRKSEDENLVTIPMATNNGSEERLLEIRFETEVFDLSPSITEVDWIKGIVLSIKGKDKSDWNLLSSWRIQEKYFEARYDDCFNLFWIKNNIWLLFLHTENSYGNMYTEDNLVMIIEEKDNSVFNYTIIE